MKFKPEFSLDTVTLILAAIGLAVWVGALKATIEQHSLTLADHEQRIRAEERLIYGVDLPTRETPGVLHTPKQMP